MVRTQIQLEERQVATLRHLAALHHVSMAELIRQAIDRFAESPESGNIAERRARSIAAIGKFRSGHRDVSKRHDDYLAEAFK
jgi:hypothetical protein